MNALLPFLTGIGQIQSLSQPTNSLQQPLPQEEEVDPVIGFSKTKRNFIGRLADALSGKPIYESRMREKDLTRAMEGFTSDPLESISRIGKIDPQAAWTLYNQHKDNERGDLVAEAGSEDKAERRRQSAFKSIGGMLGLARRENFDPKTWPVVFSRIQQMADSSGMPLPEGLTSEYDPQAIEQFFVSNIDPEDQVRMAIAEQYNNGRLSQGNRRLDLTEDNYNRVDEDRDDREEITRDRDRKRARQQQLKTMTKPHAEFAAPSGGKFKVSKSGKAVLYTNKNGSQAIFEYNNGKIGKRLVDAEKKYLKK